MGSEGRRWEVTRGIPDFLPEQIEFEDDHDHDHDHHRDVETDYASHADSAVGPLRAAYVDRSFELRHAVLRREVERLGRKLDVLDVGSGSLLKGKGRHFGTMKECARSYVGIDPSFDMLDHLLAPETGLSALPNSHVVRGVGEAIPLPAESCDVVVMLSMLDHVVDPGLVVDEARRVLRQGGMILIVLQNFGSWYRRLGRRLAPSYFKRIEDADHHHFKFTPPLTRRLLNDHGYHDIELTNYSYLLVPRMEKVEKALFSAPMALMSDGSKGRVLGAVDKVCSQLLPHQGSVFKLTGRA